MTAQDVVIVVGVVTTSVVTIVNAIGLHWGKKDTRRRLNRVNQRLMKAEDSRFRVARAITGQLDEAKSKLEIVEQNTNGNITKLMERVAQIESGMTKALAEKHPDNKDKMMVDAINGKPS